MYHKPARTKRWLKVFTRSRFVHAYLLKYTSTCKSEQLVEVHSTNRHLFIADCRSCRGTNKLQCGLRQGLATGNRQWMDRNHVALKTCWMRQLDERHTHTVQAEGSLPAPIPRGIHELLKLPSRAVSPLTMHGLGWFASLELSS